MAAGERSMQDVLLLLLGLAVPTVFVAAIAIGARRQRKRDGRPMGIHGWLVPVGLGLVLGPLYWISSLPDYLDVLKQMPPGSVYYNFILGMIALLAGIFGFMIVVAVQFFRHKRAYRLFSFYNTYLFSHL